MPPDDLADLRLLIARCDDGSAKWARSWAALWAVVCGSTYREHAEAVGRSVETCRQRATFAWRRMLRAALTPEQNRREWQQRAHVRWPKSCPAPRPHHYPLPWAEGREVPYGPPVKEWK